MRKGFTLSFCRYLASFMSVVLIACAALLWWAVGEQLPQESYLELGQENQELLVPAAPAVLTLASYNIGHGQGLKENAWDYRDRNTTLLQLNLLSEAIKKLDADIILLQEVDIDSSRTFRINQIDFLRERTGHKYYACANVWEKNYLPFPYWPISHHLGYIRAANCVISRFPLANHYRLIFDKPESNPFWYNLGYIDRGIERVDVSVGQEKIAILNIHLEAWDIKARQEQIKKTLEYIKKIKMPVIIGGDFNTLLPNAVQKNNFSDDPRADYRADHTLSWLFKAEPELVAPEILDKHSSFDLYTFPSNAPNRLLDHIFLLGEKLRFLNFEIAKEAGLASDHLPVVAKINYLGL